MKARMASAFLACPAKAEPFSEVTIGAPVKSIEETQRTGAGVSINMGEAIAIPDVITFSEFSDPDKNVLGLYELP